MDPCSSSLTQAPYFWPHRYPQSQNSLHACRQLSCTGRLDPTPWSTRHLLHLNTPHCTGSLQSVCKVVQQERRKVTEPFSPPSIRFCPDVATILSHKLLMSLISASEQSVSLKNCLTASASEFHFLSQYKSTSMEEEIGTKQDSSSTMIFIHHKDDIRRVFWYILYIILWCRDHFSN